MWEFIQWYADNVPGADELGGNLILVAFMFALLGVAAIADTVMSRTARHARRETTPPSIDSPARRERARNHRRRTVTGNAYRNR